MVRPKLDRQVSSRPTCRHFKPQGIPLARPEETGLTEDGLEALRLADVEGLYHDAAAERMGVSRPTFGRVLAEARRTVAEAITKGKAIRVEGGPVQRVPPGRCGRGGRGRCRRGWKHWKES